MATKTILVRLFVDEEIENYEGEGELRFYKLRNEFQLEDTDIPVKYLDGIGESWAQSDHYYETIQNLVAVFD